LVIGSLNCNCLAAYLERSPEVQKMLGMQSL